MDAELRKALVGTAGALQLLAFENGVEQLREFDLKATLRRCLQVQLARRVDAELSGSQPKGWKGVSTVDLVVQNSRSVMWRGALELKWAASKSKARECLWDAYKLAALYRENRTEGCYLVVAGPDSTWDEPTSRLLTLERTWKTTDFVSDLPAAFAELKTKGPAKLPAGIRTKPIGEFQFMVSERTSWWVRGARVSTTAGTFTLPV